MGPDSMMGLLRTAKETSFAVLSKPIIEGSGTLQPKDVVWSSSNHHQILGEETGNSPVFKFIEEVTNSVFEFREDF